jgi:hypothetical protein
MELPAEIPDVLDRFAEAWGRADAARVVALMTDDGVYEASVGPEPGRAFRGIEPIAKPVSTFAGHLNARPGTGAIAPARL